MLHRTQAVVTILWFILVHNVGTKGSDMILSDGSTVSKQRVVGVEHLPPNTTLEHVGESPSSYTWQPLVWLLIADNWSHTEVKTNPADL